MWDKVVIMRMQFGWVLVLAVVVSFSGCCCPMTCAPTCCSNPCWLEQMRESCDDTAAAIEDQAYRMNHAVACKFQQLSSSQSSTYLCEDCANNVGPDHGNCQDQACENYSQPVVADAHAKVKGLRQQRDPAPVQVKAKRCKRCRQVPCRCGYCEGCDGFEQSDQPYPISANTSPYQSGAGCAVPGNSGGANPDYHALPEPPGEAPPPAPAAGPTPIRPPPPPKPTPLQNSPNNPSTSIQPQSAPVTLSETFEEGPTLEPIDFEELEQPQKRQGWQPVKGSKPSQ